MQWGGTNHEELKDSRQRRGSSSSILQKSSITEASRSRIRPRTRCPTGMSNCKSARDLPREAFAKSAKPARSADRLGKPNVSEKFKRRLHLPGCAGGAVRQENRPAAIEDHAAEVRARDLPTPPRILPAEV